MQKDLPAQLDLEWYRKQAKSLVRAYGAGDLKTVARVERTLGERARERFRLTDAQWLLAREHGFRTWAEFAGRLHALERELPVGVAPAAGPLAAAFVAARAEWGERGEVQLDSGLAYGGVEPVLVHVSKRDRRYMFSDRGAAFEAAGTPAGWRETADRLESDYNVNVSRRGVVFLPAVERRSLEWLALLPDRIAEASVAFYGALLELE